MSVDGTIVEQEVCLPDPAQTYERYVDACQLRFAEEASAAKREGFLIDVPTTVEGRLLPREEFERRSAYGGFECIRIRYQSDGLGVVGYVWKPKDVANKNLPAIIYCRGGNRELSKITPWYRFGFHHFLSEGFVVLASQYRGSDGGEGRDEFGGADLHDVMNLVGVARNLGFIDLGRLFILGESRGGMMTYLAVREGFPTLAVAVIGGIVDLVSDAKVRPGLLEVLHKPLIPEFEKRPEETLRERSAVYWPERIDVPVLMLQGGADWRVNPATQTLALAQKLQEHKKTYELVVYAEDDHLLSLNREDSDRRIVQWFRRFMK